MITLLAVIVLLFPPFDYKWPEPAHSKEPATPVQKKAEPKQKHLIYVTAKWCGVCQSHQKPELERMEKLSSPPWRIGWTGKAKETDHIWEYDTEAPLVSVPYFNGGAVEMLPCFVLVDENDNELQRVYGYQTSQQLADLYSGKTPKNESTGNKLPVPSAPSLLQGQQPNSGNVRRAHRRNRI